MSELPELPEDVVKLLGSKARPWAAALGIALALAPIIGPRAFVILVYPLAASINEVKKLRYRSWADFVKHNTWRVAFVVTLLACVAVAVWPARVRNIPNGKIGIVCAISDKGDSEKNCSAYAELIED